RTFTEMEIPDSVSIWSQSIDQAAQHSTLAGYIVAGHFTVLAQRAAPWKRNDPHWPQAEAFLEKYQSAMQTWLAAWQSADPRENTAQVAARALGFLQFFDALSLWFCCALATEPDAVPTPAGPTLNLLPHVPEPNGVQKVGLDPWPLDVGSLNLEIPTRAIPVGRYTTAAALAAAPSQSIRLVWQLAPSRPNR